MDALRKAKLIDEAAISVQWLDHYFYYASSFECSVTPATRSSRSLGRAIVPRRRIC